MYRPNPNYTYSYTVGPPPVSAHRTSTSPTELTHLWIAFAVLTLDLMLLLGGPSFFRGPVPLLVGIAASAALTGFVAHEIAHKVSAQLRGYSAEFRLSPIGLIVSLLTASAGFLFAAPGATMIVGMANLRDWGRTSLAGPATNFAFALVFLAAALVAPSPSGASSLPASLLFLAYINGWFAAFNMIPFGPLDGAKVLRWSRPVWVGSFLVFAALAGTLFYLVNYGVLPHL
ncbi:MAG: metalloprotease [Thermoplasmata archaeon]|nr:metalloprotease [Thermoplasmata archaeon]